MRGDVVRLRHDAATRGHEQRGHRFAIVVQSDALPLSTLIVAPTSTTARPTMFRPEIELDGVTTRVLVEQLRAVDPTRLGGLAGRVDPGEMAEIDQALIGVLGLL